MFSVFHDLFWVSPSSRPRWYSRRVLGHQTLSACICARSRPGTQPHTTLCHGHEWQSHACTRRHKKCKKFKLDSVKPLQNGTEKERIATLYRQNILSNMLKKSFKDEFNIKVYNKCTFVLKAKHCLYISWLLKWRTLAEKTKRSINGSWQRRRKGLDGSGGFCGGFN